MTDYITLSEIRYYPYDNFKVVATAAGNVYLGMIDCAGMFQKAAFVSFKQQQEINLLIDIKSTAGKDPKIVNTILERVSACFGIDKTRLTERTRAEEIVFPRQLCMYFISRKTYLHPRMIGKIFGFDRNTVLYAIKHIEWLIETDKKTRMLITDLQNGL